jgi:hypothetical protein
LRDLSDWVVDLSGFERGDEMSVDWTGSAQLYRLCDDSLEIVVKFVDLFGRDEDCKIKIEIEKLRNE